MEKKQIVMLVGGVIGAVLGAGVAYLLMVAPSNLPEGQEPEAITATELITLTGGLAIVARHLDDLRHKL